jgi:hypothetical protein
MAIAGPLALSSVARRFLVDIRHRIIPQRRLTGTLRVASVYCRLIHAHVVTLSTSWLQTIFAVNSGSGTP